MPLHESRVTARIPVRPQIVRGVDTTLYCPLYQSGALVEPDTTEFTLYDADGDAVLEGESATITASVAQYTVQDTATTALELGDGWLVVWDHVLDGGVPMQVRSDAALIRTPLYPVISDVDLIRRLNSLDTSSASRITRATTYQDQIDESFVEIENRLIASNRRPWLVLQPGALREAHLNLALAYVFADLASRNEAAYGESEKRHRALYDDAWDRITFTYDTTNENRVGRRRRRAGASTVWLGGGGDE